jgi:hypothetical protein
MQPTFVFEGTVRRLNSATMKDVPIDRRTAVVNVDRTIEAPPDLTGYDGRDITVRLSGRRRVRARQRMIFHATGWIHGDSVAVQSLEEEPVTRGATVRGGAGDPVERGARGRTRGDVDAADLVVDGKVVTVRLPRESTRGRARAGGKTAGPISEHDPQWREAVIQVDKVLKGAPGQKQIVVRFPASSDVLWHDTPKLHPGQEGQFILRKAKPARSATKGVYLAVRDPGAVEPEP